MHNSLRVALLLGPVVGALAGWTIACNGGDDVQQGPAEAGYLLAASRTELSVCVDGAGSFTISDTEVDKVRNALGRALADAKNPPTDYRDPTVGSGCPAPVVLTGRRIDFIDRYSVEVPVRFLNSAADASPHRLHVYVVGAEEYAVTFGDDQYATTAEERICEGDVCNWVTQGLYVKPSTETDVLERALRAALGLMPPLPEPTEYSQFCLSGTPEEWCYLYEYCQGVPTDAKCEIRDGDPTARPETPISQFP